MNENDSLRKHALDLIDNTERQRRFLQGLGGFQVDLPRQLTKELAIASEAIAAFRMNPGFKSFLAEIEPMSVANARFGKELAERLLRSTAVSQSYKRISRHSLNCTRERSRT